LFVPVQPEAGEGVKGDHANEGIEAGGDGARMEISTRGSSAAETAGDDVEEEANVYTKALTTDAATTPEV
jgi:hypothetical protein